MKSNILITAVGTPSVISAQWWKGAPECAQSCLSAAWTNPTAVTTSWWPHQSEYCHDQDKGKEIDTCISAACDATMTAYTSYISLSASLCSRHASCTSAGKTGVQTVTYAGGPVTWATPGGWGNNNKNYGGNHGGGKGQLQGQGHGGSFEGVNNKHTAEVKQNTEEVVNVKSQWGGPNGSTGYSQYWADWESAYRKSKTWSGGVATVTGCAFDGSPWFVGPNCGWNGLGGFNGFVGWGSGWSWGPTQTQDVTILTTDASGAAATQTGVETVAVAVSGALTTSSVIGNSLAQATGGGQGNAAAARPGSLMTPGFVAAEGSVVHFFLGVGLITVIGVAGLL